MGDDDSPDISTSDTGTTTTFDNSSSDTGSPSAPTDTGAQPAPTDGGGQQAYLGISPASSFTDQNLPAALLAVDNVAGMQGLVPNSANPAADSSSETAASSNNPQAQITQAAAQSSGSAPASAPQPESLVSKIGGGLLALAKSSGGGAILGNILQGISAGKAQEAAIAEHRRYTAPFTSDQFNTLMSGANVQAPMGYLERARRVGDFLRNGAQPSYGAPTAPPPARFGG